MRQIRKMATRINCQFLATSDPLAYDEIADLILELTNK